jgi:hypothetical protein
MPAIGRRSISVEFHGVRLTVAQTQMKAFVSTCSRKPKFSFNAVDANSITRSIVPTGLLFFIFFPLVQQVNATML